MISLAALGNHGAIALKRSPSPVVPVASLTLPVGVGHSCPTPLTCVARAPSPAKACTSARLQPCRHSHTTTLSFPSVVEEPALSFRRWRAFGEWKTGETSRLSPDFLKSDLGTPGKFVTQLFPGCPSPTRNRWQDANGRLQLPATGLLASSKCLRPSHPARAAPAFLGLPCVDGDHLRLPEAACRNRHRGLFRNARRTLGTRAKQFGPEVTMVIRCKSRLAHRRWKRE